MYIVGISAEILF